MNREIEFRAWLKYKKEMADVTTIDFKKRCVLIDKPYFPKIPEYCGTTLLFDQIELMQYTGLKDKNGVKIFEGDIVKFEDSILRIIYDDEECRFIMTKEPDNILSYRALTIWRYNKIEVIGNIYENKNLLEVS